MLLIFQMILKVRAGSSAQARLRVLSISLKDHALRLLNASSVAEPVELKAGAPFAVNVRLSVMSAVMSGLVGT